MEYVKIIGDNHQDALFKAKMQYGDTVIPVNHKTIKVGGLLGSNFFAKNAVELIAAIPERSRAKALTPDLLDEKEAKMALLKNPSEGNALKEKTDIHLKKVADKKFASPEDISLIKDNKSVKALQDLIQKKLMMENDSFQSTALHKTIYQGDEKKSLQEKRRPVMERNAPSRDFSTEDNMLYGSNGSAMGKIEKTLAEIQKSIDNLQIQNSFKNQKNFYETNLDFWQKKLLDADFSQDYVKLLLHDLKDQLSIAEQGDKNIVEKKLVQLLQKKIGITPPLLRSDEKRKVVMMIGATGVGKTTTMAKLGAIYTFYENRKVVFVTIDNYRIAATEQLKRYSSIINVPTYVVNQPRELEKILSEEDAELILIDTSGRGPYNQEHLEDCNGILKNISANVEKILITQATLKRMDQEAIFQNFNKIGIDKVILTKIDETLSNGGFFEIADKFNKGLSYVTFGQDVPTDIQEADSLSLARMIIGRHAYK